MSQIWCKKFGLNGKLAYLHKLVIVYFYNFTLIIKITQNEILNDKANSCLVWKILATTFWLSTSSYVFFSVTISWREIQWRWKALRPITHSLQPLSNQNGKKVQRFWNVLQKISSICYPKSHDSKEKCFCTF